MLNFIYHNPGKAGVKRAPDGYILLSSMLEHRAMQGLDLDEEKVENIVNTCKKKLFSIRRKQNIAYIKALKSRCTAIRLVMHHEGNED